MDSQKENTLEEKQKTPSWLIWSSVAIFSTIVFGLLWFFLGSSVPQNVSGGGSDLRAFWFLFSFGAGLTMIVLPCTLPLAFVIVPLSMGKGLIKGVGMALSFGVGVAITLSLYGVAAALVGKAAIGTLGADLDTVKNWTYFVAGIFAFLFALGSIGLVKFTMPTYKGAAPKAIQEKKDYIKAFMMGLFLGNIGIGCPHPATPLILVEIATSGNVLYGWALFFVHAVGRVLPLLLLAFMGIMGVNGLSWLVARREKVEKVTGWGMVFVAGFILTLGLFTHDWWVNSGTHTVFEKIVQEERFTGAIAENLGVGNAHVHGAEDGFGLFGQPLWLGNWFLVFVWVVPIWWWWVREKKRVKMLAEGNTVSEKEEEEKVLGVRKWLFVVFTFSFGILFVFIFPHMFMQHWSLEHGEPNGTMVHGDHTVPGVRTGDIPGFYSRDTSRLPLAKNETEIVSLNNGDTYNIVASMVKKEVGNRIVKMLAYNGSVPGPLIRVDQGSAITINFTNNTDVPTTVHSHGIRIDNRFDGVPGSTQNEVRPGESFVYKVNFPDAGMYWYHPHVREDYSQDLGLYGNYLVDARDSDYWSPVNQEVALMVDDVLLDDVGIAPYSMERVDHIIMGRYGDVMLVNGRTDYSLQVREGEVVRLYVTNTSSARTFKLSIPGARVKRVGADAGRYEHEEFVDSFLVSSSERVVVEAYFPNPGSYTLVHTTPVGVHEMARFTAIQQTARPSYENEFFTLRDNSEVIDEFAPLREYFYKQPDKRLRLAVDFSGLGEAHDHSQHGGGATPATSPSDDGHTDHSHSALPANFTGVAHAAEEDAMAHDHSAHTGGANDGKIIWEDVVGQQNVDSTSNSVAWQMIDEDTGKISMDIDWKFTVGDMVKVRIVNDPNADHPMQHPIHFHGNRFVVLAMNGAPNPNLVWKDTSLIPTGETHDFLVEMSNPGVWMAHCHISEHLHAGMMLSYRVESEDGSAPGDDYRDSLPEGTHVMMDGTVMNSGMMHVMEDGTVMEGEMHMEENNQAQEDEHAHAPGTPADHHQNDAVGDGHTDHDHGDTSGHLHDDGSVHVHSTQNTTTQKVWLALISLLLMAGLSLWVRKYVMTDSQEKRN